MRIEKRKNIFIYNLFFIFYIRYKKKHTPHTPFYQFITKGILNMSEKDVYSNSNTQLDIMDEAINLIDVASRETYQLTFAEALEIMKIQRLDEINKTLDFYASETGSTLQECTNDICKELSHIAFEI